jgi:hypothetical protein
MCYIDGQKSKYSANLTSLLGHINDCIKLNEMRLYVILKKWYSEFVSNLGCRQQ